MFFFLVYRVSFRVSSDMRHLSITSALLNYFGVTEKLYSDAISTVVIGDIIIEAFSEHMYRI